MSGYALAYRLGITPWERYGSAAASSIAALLDREEADRARPLGRALDLGCGRGQYAPELVRRGWQVVGVDAEPRAVDAARSRSSPEATFLVRDVTRLTPEDLGTFDFFLDVGCLQGLRPAQRRAQGGAVTALANDGAALLVLAFGPTRLRSLVGGLSQLDVESAFPGWQLLSADPADPRGLGWPMSRSAPRWYRLRRTIRGGPVHVL